MVSQTSVVIVSCNALVPLRAMLTKMDLEHSMANEVMVVDNGSTDGTPDMVAKEFPTVRLIRQKSNGGFAAAANKGIREATGQTVILCHADVLAEIHQLMELADRLHTASRAAVVMARLKTIDGSEQPMVGTIPTLSTMISAVFKPQLARRCETASLDHLADHQWSPFVCAAIDISSLEKAGVFDPTFFLHFADMDLCKRLHDKRLRILLHPDISVTHAGTAPGGALADFQKRLARKDLLRYVDKHADGWHKMVVGWTDTLRAKVFKET